jgi:L,D-peptidoglycan transpeptidase YkuD (ErfK/YbiS/YcfS/YnhG family)
MVMLGLALIGILAIGGCAHLLPSGSSEVLPAPPATVAKAVEGGSIPAEQLLLVISQGEQSSRATLYVLERSGNGWIPKSESIPAMIGRTGFARPGEKREGDGHTPSGLFPLESVFGYAPSVQTRMPYRQATAQDIWVDDVNSPDYNTWKRKGESGAKSFEEMKLPDASYRHGVVIGYNRNPIVVGKGSAIFLHVWRGDGRPTAGCVAIDEQELIRIIGWLDPAKQPMILMGNRSDLASLPGLAGLAQTR